MSQRGQPRNPRRIPAGRTEKAASQSDKSFGILFKKHPHLLRAFLWSGIAGAAIFFFGPEVKGAFEEI